MLIEHVTTCNMDVKTEVTEREVIIRVDGEQVGSLDREFWNEWSARIDNDPETCLSACLASGEVSIDV